MDAKRDGGQQTAERYFLVLTESTRQEDGSWVHSCGNAVMSAHVTFSHRIGSLMPLAGDGSVKSLDIPFCPECERKPVSGTYNDSGFWHIETYA